MKSELTNHLLAWREIFLLRSPFFDLPLESSLRLYLLFGSLFVVTMPDSDSDADNYVPSDGESDFDEVDLCQTTDTRQENAPPTASTSGAATGTGVPDDQVDESIRHSNDSDSDTDEVSV